MLQPKHNKGLEAISGENHSKPWLGKALKKKKKLFSPSHRASQISVGSQNSDTSVPKRNEHTQFVLIRIKLTTAWSTSYKNIIDMIETIFKLLKVTTGLFCHSWCPFSLASSTELCSGNVSSGQVNIWKSFLWDNVAPEAFTASQIALRLNLRCVF